MGNIPLFLHGKVSIVTKAAYTGGGFQGDNNNTHIPLCLQLLMLSVLKIILRLHFHLNMIEYK